MPEFNIGDEVLVPGTVISKSTLGHPIVRVVSGTGPRTISAPGAIPAPKPPEYVFTFEVTVHKDLSVAAINQTDAEREAVKKAHNEFGNRYNSIELSEVTLNGKGVGEWPR